MATLRQYFDTDFSHVLKVGMPWSVNCDGHRIEIYASANFDFDAGVQFASYYVPLCANPARVCDLLLTNVQVLFETARAQVLIQTSLPGTRTENINELKFSGRVFVYSEKKIDEQGLASIEERARAVGQTFRFRSEEMVIARSALEKPLAFISHDWRDKDDIARPLAIELSKVMCRVWYDEFSLKIGDSLRERVETGLKQCGKCILILSPNYLSNCGWTKVEFNSIFTRELVERKRVILPVWCGVTKEQVYQYSPSLADRLAANWSAGISEVTRLLSRSITDAGTWRAKRFPNET
jgi:hypothetical protein